MNDEKRPVPDDTGDPALKITEIRHAPVGLSRFADASITQPSLTTSIVAIMSDRHDRNGPLVGFGFGSFGRYAQDGLISERFAPRLLNAPPGDILDENQDGIDPFKAWSTIMRGEKPGGHGERCVAVGAIDMALWDLAAKTAELPLYRHLNQVTEQSDTQPDVPVYAGGGYLYPDRDLALLRDEMNGFVERGFTKAKIKIGASSISTDIKRIETALDSFACGKQLAVDAMNAYSPAEANEAAGLLAPYDLMWFEDVCDPLDFETHEKICSDYAPPISVGEALFSCADAQNLLRYASLRPHHDVMTFDPVHCYGLPEYIRIIEMFEKWGWSRKSFNPHGGHLFSLHVSAGLGLGGCECNPNIFQPLGGFAPDALIQQGKMRPPDMPGIGFETRPDQMDLFKTLLFS
ncbi:MAG: enolase C-terminal domain-like protein [Stappiaceae bacterium]